jgi:hypothetical protein
MREGNKAIRDHLEAGRALRLFEKDGTSVIYVGEFSVPDESHWLIDEAPDRDGMKRSVFVFRLKPQSEVWVDPALQAPPATLASSIPLEAVNVESYIQERRASEPLEGLRNEALLVRRYVAWLKIHGVQQSSGTPFRLPPVAPCTPMSSLERPASSSKPRRPRPANIFEWRLARSSTTPGMWIIPA